MKFRLFMEADFRDVEDIIRRASKAYQRGGDSALHRMMMKYWNPEFADRFKQWWQKGYYRDLDDYGINIGGTKFYTDNPNPNYYYFFAKIAKSEASVKGRYRKMEDYLRDGWEAYARRGSQGLADWVGTLPEGFFAKFRRYMIDHGGQIFKDSGLHYQLYQWIKNMADPENVKLNVGDYLHRQRTADLIKSPYSNRDTFKNYPDLQQQYDDYVTRKQQEREERRRGTSEGNA